MIRSSIFLIILSVFLMGCSKTQQERPDDPPKPQVSIDFQVQKLHESAPPDTDNQQALRIHALLPHYAALQHEPWPDIYPRQLPLRDGVSDPTVPLIRQRLVQLGDMMTALSDSNSQLFDASLSRGLARYQWRHGLKSDGVLGLKTLKALNVTPKARVAQLRDSMKKWAAFSDARNSRYLLINIPNYQLVLIDQGQPVLSMKVIIGKYSRPTPVLESAIGAVVLNPKWKVPTYIANHDILPKIIKNPGYLAAHGIEVFSSWKKGGVQIDPDSIDWQKAYKEGFPYRFVQMPGPNNALGQVEFLFANHYKVFLHDTPEKSLFKNKDRAYSSGCIRLEKPFALLEYLMKDTPTYTDDMVQKILSERKTKILKLQVPIPIYITYITAWVDGHGVAHFNEDIYGWGKAEFPASDDNLMLQ